MIYVKRLFVLPNISMMAFNTIRYMCIRTQVKYYIDMLYCYKSIPFEAPKVFAKHEVSQPLSFHTSTTTEYVYYVP